jgi:hypothetical protein
MILYHIFSKIAIPFLKKVLIFPNFFRFLAERNGMQVFSAFAHTVLYRFLEKEKEYEAISKICLCAFIFVVFLCGSSADIGGGERVRPCDGAWQCLGRGTCRQCRDTV